MSTTLPGNASKANSDASTDDPEQAILVDLAGVVDKFNSLKGALGAAAQLSLGDGLETVAQAGGTPDDIRVKLQGVSALARAATGIAVDIAGQTALGSAADDDEFLIWDTSAGAFRKIAASALSQIPRGYIDGYQMVRNGADFQNLDVGVGQARNDADDGAIALASAFTKRLDATFVAGSGNGMLDAGAIAATTWYHVFAIKNPTSGAVDVLASTSLAAPTMPTGFTKKRRIGSVLTDGTPNIVEFVQRGARFLWKSPPLDVNTAAQSTTAVLYTLSVPPGVEVDTAVNAQISDNGAVDLYISSPLVNDEVASPTAAPLANLRINNDRAFAKIAVRTNTSQQIRARANNSLSDFRIATLGWADDRGKNE